MHILRPPAAPDGSFAVPRLAARGLAVAALLLAGCSRGPPRMGSPLSGEWVSTLNSEFVILRLEQVGTRVLGAGQLRPHGVPASYRVEGQAGGRSLTARLRADGAAPVTVRAILHGDTLTARLDGGGYTNRLVPLVRGR
jgi:hypothetical protein